MLNPNSNDTASAPQYCCPTKSNTKNVLTFGQAYHLEALNQPENELISPLLF